MGNESSNYQQKQGFYTPRARNPTPRVVYKDVKDFDVILNEISDEIDDGYKDKDTFDSQQLEPTFSFTDKSIFGSNTPNNNNNNKNNSKSSHAPYNVPSYDRSLQKFVSINTEKKKLQIAKLDQENKDIYHIDLSFVPANHIINKIDNIFKYKKQLGYGASCRVVLAKHRESKKKYALKEMHRTEESNLVLFAQEYKILNELTHHNIIDCFGSWIDKNCFYLATSYCSGGTMLDRIIKQHHFSEKECADFIKTVLSAVQYMHSRNIVHRDLKCNNIVFDKPGKDGVLKIIDFGCSELISDVNEQDLQMVGSMHYLPPEIFGVCRKGDLFKGDVWSIGVICYVLVSGKVPFYGNNQEETLESVKKGVFEWPDNVKLSASCKSFIRSLLEKNPHKRSTPMQALKHPWIISKASTLTFGKEYMNQMTSFQYANRLQRILINAILSEMNKEDRKLLLRSIRDLDMNGNGQLHDKDIIDYILLHGNVNRSGDHAEQRANQVMSHLKTHQKQHVSISHISLSDMDVERILNQIDEIEESQSVSQYNGGGGGGSPRSHYIIPPMTPKAYRPAISGMHLQVSESLDDEKKHSLMEEQMRLGYSIESNVSDSSADLQDFLLDDAPATERKISINRFRSIMENVESDYNVDKIVKKLGPRSSGTITLSSIANFKLHTPGNSNNMENMTPNLSFDPITDMQDDTWVIAEDDNEFYYPDTN